MTAQLPAGVSKAAVRRFWNAQPCGVKSVDGEPGTAAFYAALEAHRYAEEFHIPEVVGFTQHGGRRVLEVGGGLGTDGRQFARAGAWYVDADLSDQSLRLARNGFALEALAGRFVNSDAENLPFRDVSFDVVYSHGVLHHTPDTARAVDEVRRVLKPGGLAIIMLYAKESAAYLIGVPLLGRLRLAVARRRMGRQAFNRMVGLPEHFRGRLPRQVVINNSTDGLGNPLSRFYSAAEIRTLFDGFSEVRLDKRYFHRRKIPLIGQLLPNSLLGWLGRLAGGYWYVTAIRKRD